MMTTRTMVLVGAFLLGCGCDTTSDSDAGPTDLGAPDGELADGDVTPIDTAPSLPQQCQNACGVLDSCGDSTFHDGCLSFCISGGLAAVADCVLPPVDCDEAAVCLGLKEPPPAVTWTEQIRPICVQSCGPCHTANRAGSVQVNTYADVIKPSPKCLPGKTIAESLALKVQANPSCGNQMPPGDKPKLTVAEQQLFIDWIALGWPE